MRAQVQAANQGENDQIPPSSQDPVALGMPPQDSPVLQTQVQAVDQGYSEHNSFSIGQDQDEAPEISTRPPLTAVLNETRVRSISSLPTLEATLVRENSVYDAVPCTGGDGDSIKRLISSLKKHNKCLVWGGFLAMLCLIVAVSVAVRFAAVVGAMLKDNSNDIDAPGDGIWGGSKAPTPPPTAPINLTEAPQDTPPTSDRPAAPIGLDALYAVNECTLEDPCQKCAGDCNIDDHCIGRLRCFLRNDTARVPGCVEGGRGDIPGAGYCHDPKGHSNATPPGTPPAPSPNPPTSGTYSSSMPSTTSSQSPGSSSADDISFVMSLSAEGPSMGSLSRYGSSVAISGDGSLVAVGVTEAINGHMGEAAGAVYLYSLDTSTHESIGNVSSTSASLMQVLYGQSPMDEFGNAVALSQDGDRLVVGSRSENEQTGAMRVYHRDGANPSSSWSLMEGGIVLGNFPAGRAGWSVSVSTDGNGEGMLIITSLFESSSSPSTFSRCCSRSGRNGLAQGRH